MSVSLEEVAERLARIEQALQVIAKQRAIKEFYSTGDVASIVGKSEFTVREWARLGRINAEKRPCGRGTSQEWMISHEELQRIQSEGLLPDPSRYRHVR